MLVGRNTSNESEVEIFINGLWGSVCSSGWNIDAGDVVCHELGYIGANSVTSIPIPIDGTKVSWIDDVICVGNETELTACAFVNKIDGICDEGMVAGVACNSKLFTLTILCTILLVI